MSLIFLLVLFGAMYFFTIRPQQQRLRNQRALMASLQVGDEVVTMGGLIGRVSSLDEVELRLDTGDASVRVSRAAVTQRLSAGDS